jgi:hypothetical protein
VHYLEQEMKRNPKLSAQQLQSQFLSSYLKPALKAQGYKNEEQIWWKEKQGFFLLIQLQNFPWCKDSLAFCFNIGMSVTLPNFSSYAPETAYISPKRKKHKYKRKIGYSVTDSALLSDYIQELKADFETEILPRLESLQTLDDCRKFYQHFPSFNEGAFQMRHENIEGLFP